eukprot:COSAG03_NODE_638_length_6574_cov_63.934054_4_plen_62_part_00
MSTSSTPSLCLSSLSLCCLCLPLSSLSLPLSASLSVALPVRLVVKQLPRRPHHLLAAPVKQ